MNVVAVQLVKEFEQCRLNAYQDGGGVWTVGWGATGPDVVRGTVWSQMQADSRLALDLERTELALQKVVRTPLNESQLGALISLSYNVGTGGVAGSKTLMYLNAKRWLAMVHEWLDFDHDGGAEVQGLLKRRLKECYVFLEHT